MLLDASESQLVLVDYQARLMPAIFEGPHVLANALRLAQLAQTFDVPAFGTEQSPDNLGPNPAELRALCRKTLAKMHFSAVATSTASSVPSTGVTRRAFAAAAAALGPGPPPYSSLSAAGTPPAPAWR